MSVIRRKRKHTSEASTQTPASLPKRTSSRSRSRCSCAATAGGSTLHTHANVAKRKHVFGAKGVHGLSYSRSCSRCSCAATVAGSTLHTHGRAALMALPAHDGSAHAVTYNS